jgi:hypothetical protein
VKPKGRVEERVIEGVLIPVGWGPCGEVSQVSLMTFDEAEYRVDVAAVEAHHLRDYLRKRVRILGRTRGSRVVRVTAVEALETSDGGNRRDEKNGRRDP